MGGNPVLFVAHPGHELLVFGWMVSTAPRVFILTDGSGRVGNPRTHYSRELVQEAGASAGSIFGRFSDAAIYRVLLDRTHDDLVHVAHDLAREFRDDPPACVVTDSLEGYNPVHDLCRWIAGAALRIAGCDAPQYEFSTTGRPMSGGFTVELPEDVIERKIAAAMKYEPLRDEVTAKLDRFGREFLRTEPFASIAAWNDTSGFESSKPEYEQIGEDRVAGGVYRETIRFRDHLLPVRESLCAEALVRS
ncbi:MAG TPA: hypothetical protein VNA69_02755 [Thermoanaerobaculia bacterium]|nr:hypothetical protein [Thermoanaerobaculia bacterium]